jgi:hypothetical protein
LDRESGRAKGFAYVEFKSADALKKALKFNGSEFFQRNIRVDVSESKPKNTFQKDEGFQKHRNNRYEQKSERENISRYDSSRYEKPTDSAPTPSEGEGKWGRKTKEQPKPKDFSSKPNSFSSNNNSNSSNQTEKKVSNYSNSNNNQTTDKKVEKDSDLFGAGKAWVPKDDIDKKIEEKLEREKEERRKKSEEQSDFKTSSKKKYEKKGYSQKDKEGYSHKEEKEEKKPSTYQTTTQPKEVKKPSNTFDVLGNE